MNAEGARLKALFVRRDYLVDQLAEVDRHIGKAATAYHNTKGRGVRPRLEALRKEVGA